MYLCGDTGGIGLWKQGAFVYRHSDTDTPLRNMLQVALMNICHRLISLSAHRMESIMRRHSPFGHVPKRPWRASVLFACVLHVEFDLL